jgi:putative ABC transport system permease protein
MTPEGLNRTLNLESIMCSLKSLLYGAPLGIIGSYLVSRSMNMPVELNYSPPWLPILQCALGVLAVTWVTMRWSASRLRGGSVIDTIRADGNI